MAGDGTQQNPFEVATLADLQKVGSGDDGWDLDKHYNQVADIDASPTTNWNDGEGFVPIGDGDNLFTGRYNGRGYKIDGLYLNRGASDQGLFYRPEGVFQNIRLTNINITGTQYIGGIIGNNIRGANIIECCVTGSISATGNYIGGICGQNSGGDHDIIENCYSAVAVYGNAVVGGLLGRNVGGNGVTKCYSVGAVSAAGTNYIGGFVGRNQGSVSASFYDTTTSGQSDTGNGEPFTTAEMMDIDTYLDAGWDICEIGEFNPANPTTWFIDDGNDYPRLWYEYKAEEEPQQFSITFQTRRKLISSIERTNQSQRNLMKLAEAQTQTQRKLQAVTVIQGQTERKLTEKAIVKGQTQRKLTALVLVKAPAIRRLKAQVKQKYQIMRKLTTEIKTEGQVQRRLTVLAKVVGQTHRRLLALVTVQGQIQRRLQSLISRVWQTVRNLRDRVFWRETIRFDAVITTKIEIDTSIAMKIERTVEL